MRALPWVIAGSLILNGALGVALWQQETAPARIEASSTAATSRPAPVTPLSTPVLAGLGASDAGELRAKLRASGCPPELEQAIVTAWIREHFAARRRALGDPEAQTPYWKKPDRDIARENALKDLGRAEREALRDARSFTSPIHTAREEFGLAALPAQKAARVREILQQQAAARDGLMWTAEPGDGDAIGAKLAQSMAEERQAIAALLTPQELLDFELRISPTAERLRSTLGAFKPSEAEFRALFAIEQAYDLSRQNGLFAGREAESRRAATQAQVTAALGAERAAFYQRATTREYALTGLLVARLQLPSEATEQLYRVKQSFEQRQKEATAASGSAAEQQARVEGLRREAQAQVEAVLRTAENVEAYRLYGGSWLNRSTPAGARVNGAR